MTRRTALRVLSQDGLLLVSTRTPDGGVLDIVLRYDACELNVGGRKIYQFEVGTREVVRMAWGVLKWWCLRALFGWRLRRWERAMSRVYDDRRSV